MIADDNKNNNDKDEEEEKKKQQSRIDQTNPNIFGLTTHSIFSVLFHVLSRSKCDM